MAAQEEKKVGFSAQDNGVSSFIKRLQNDTKQLFSEMARESEKQGKNQKEQLKLIEEQIAALERQNRLEREQNRLILERKREAGQLNNKQYAAERNAINGDTATNRLQMSLLKDLLNQLKEDKRNQPSEEPASPAEEAKKGGSMFNAVLGAQIFKDMMGLIRQMPGARSDVDLLSPFSSMMGGAAGGLVGLAAGYNAAAGATIGKEIGGFIGDALTRHINESEKYDTAVKRVRGRTGSSRSEAYDMSFLGMDWVAGAGFEEQLASAGGRGYSGDEVLRIARASRAYSLDRGQLAGYEGLVSRMGGSDSELNESRLITEALKQGVNQSALPDLFKGMTTLVTLMGSTRRGAGDNNAMQMMMEFHKMGFDIRDPRTMGIMTSVQNGLTNPSSPFGQALSYSMLRKNNANGSFLDLMIDRQKGGSDMAGQFIKNISDMVGGREDLAVPMIAQQFGLSGNLEAARDLFRGRGKLGSLSGQSISEGDYQGIASLANTLTPELEKTQASITNAFIVGATDGIEAITVHFKDRMMKMIDVMVEEQVAKLKSAFGIGKGKGKVPFKNGAQTTW